MTNDAGGGIWLSAVAECAPTCRRVGDKAVLHN